MNRNRNKILLLIFSFVSLNIYSQNASKIFYSYLLELNNPSLAGLSEISHLTLLSNQTYDLNKRSYGYENFIGNYYFEENNFFLGSKISSNHFSDIGLNSMSIDVSYTHKLKLSKNFFVENVTIYPHITASYSFPISLSNVLLEDELLSGLSSIDPLYQLNNSVGYIDFNAGFLLKNDQYMLGFTINNLRQANTATDEENIARISRSADVVFGYQREFERFGIFVLGSYFHRPSINKEITFSSFRLDQEFMFNNFRLNIFEEFNKNTFQTGLRNIGLSFRYTINEFDFGIGYRSPIGKNSFNNENSFEAIFRYNFDFLGFISNLRWEDGGYF
tara:strand:+ start:1943 stop:2938 length:996 start_codon:yes stop_codon:yes gene_type:complete